MHLKTIALAGTLAASLLAANSAQAGSIVGLIDGQSIVTIDPATRKGPARAGLKGAASVVGIDVRPADGLLYAVTADGGIYTIDARSGAATMKSKLSEPLKGGAPR